MLGRNRGPRKPTARLRSHWQGRSRTLSDVNPAELIDLERYPVGELDSQHGRAMLAEARRSLAEKGVAILPGFVLPEAIGELAREVAALKPRAHREDVAVGTPYLELPDEAYPLGHPRRTDIHSVTWVIAYDRVPLHSRLRALYEWDPLMRLVGAILERGPLFRFADPLGALNLTIMDEGDIRGWHFDSTDFVVSLAVQSPQGGGLFECAPFIRSEDDECYDQVARVLAGEGRDRLEVFPMTPGTLMIFAGRHSLHRVTPVEGARPRYVALMSYDTRPGTDAGPLLKLVRYGRSEAESPPP
jgi:hypothetical protein